MHSRDWLSQDMKANGLVEWRWYYRLMKPIPHFLYLLRKCEDLRGSRSRFGRVKYLIVRWQFERLSERLGFSIPLGVFGPGLSIAHRGTIVVNGDARVGSRCRIHPGVTIGGHRGSAPLVGDDVFLGPNCVLIGGIDVGSGAKIGPLALVNRDVPARATVVAHRAESLRPES